VFYHTGRILVYALGGLLFGLLGRHIYLAGWQQGFSIGMGILILAIFLARRLKATPALKLSGWLMRAMGPFWRSPSAPGFFVLGIANGLLPCGMVYLAIAAATTRGSVGEGVLFMLFFGAGTLPLLATAQYLGRIWGQAFRFRLRRMLPLVTVLVALLLILRGMNLGIPYLSPRMAAAPQRVVSCH
jgi:sulfite exporter TauE/SafE